MKPIRQLLFFVLSLFWFSSCDKEGIEMDVPGDKFTGEAICFELDFPGENGTRTTTNTSFKTSWIANDEVGVYVVKGSAGLLAEGNYVDNLKMTYNGSRWIKEREIYYPNDGESLSFYAYYPYDETMSDPTDYTFSIQTDQQEKFGSNYYKSDFLWAKLESIYKSENVVPLQFSHTMAMVRVKIGKYPSEDINYERIPFLKGLLIDSKINLNTQTILPGSAKNDVRMYWNLTQNQGGTSYFHIYWAALPPQTTDIHFQWFYDKVLYECTPATDVTLTGGNIKLYEITMP